MSEAALKILLRPLVDMTTRRSMAPIQEERGAPTFHELLLVSQPSGVNLRTNLNTSLKGISFFFVKQTCVSDPHTGTKNGACVFSISLRRVCELNVCVLSVCVLSVCFE